MIVQEDLKNSVNMAWKETALMETEDRNEMQFWLQPAPKHQPLKRVLLTPMEDVVHNKVTQVLEVLGHVLCRTTKFAISALRTTVHVIRGQ